MALCRFSPCRCNAPGTSIRGQHSRAGASQHGAAGVRAGSQQRTLGEISPPRPGGCGGGSSSSRRRRPAYGRGSHFIVIVVLRCLCLVRHASGCDLFIACAVRQGWLGDTTRREHRQLAVPSMCAKQAMPPSNTPAAAWTPGSMACAGMRGGQGQLNASSWGQGGGGRSLRGSSHWLISAPGTKKYAVSDSLSCGGRDDARAGC